MGDINIVERFHQEHGTPDWLKYQSEGKKGEGFNQWLRRIVLQDDPESSIISFTTSYALKNGLEFDPLGDNIPSGSGGSDAGKPSRQRE